jgi:hypothetical protein
VTGPVPRLPNIGRDDGRPYSDNRQVGHGWNVYSRIV